MRKRTALLLLLATAAASATSPLVGVNYFAGWWRGAGDKWYEPWNASTDWRPLFPGRVPLGGMYTTDQSTMDNDIVVASSHGVDFFQILWYDNRPSERAPGSQHLNDGLALFMASEEAHRMAFIIEWCTLALPLFGVHTDTEWHRMIETDGLPAFRHPSCLRVDGKLVFKVHSGPDFMANSSSSPAAHNAVEQRLNALREAVRGVGLGEMIIGAGSTIDDTSDPAQWWGYEYNFTHAYSGVAQDDARWAGRVLPWRNESGYIREWRRKQAAAAAAVASSQHRRSYVPTVVSGWDPRPWRERRASYTFPTAIEWRDELSMIASEMQNHGNMGFPIDGGAGVSPRSRFTPGMNSGKAESSRRALLGIPLGSMSSRLSSLLLQTSREASRSKSRQPQRPPLACSERSTRQWRQGARKLPSRRARITFRAALSRSVGRSLGFGFVVPARPRRRYGFRRAMASKWWTPSM